MKKTSKFVLIFVFFVACLYIIFRLSLPTLIVAIHKDQYVNNILVVNPPLTDKAKIHWWKKNKAKIKSYFDIPSSRSDGTFTIIFWDFGDGYSPLTPRNLDMLPGNNTDYLYCFDDMKVKANCIEKKQIMTITKSTSGRIYITTNKRYLLKENGKFIEEKE
ncbi:DUF943 family protein [Paramixta manurensis]|uniref:DUF943 family protein n=1 Tax=Paramixta manurensis TaxID=2740817 RepID=A0A6M8U8Q4_9GAMM|nr:DUF943 family protein [Erwiniaceae bacterium PD-1]